MGVVANSKGFAFSHDKLLMNEHRRDPRIKEHADVSVKIQSAPEVRDIEGRVFPFHSEDVSLHGIKMSVDIPVPIGVLLELEIMLHNSSMKYRFLGSVVWADAVDDDNLEHDCWHKIGISLHTQANPQFDSWATSISNL